MTSQQLECQSLQSEGKHKPLHLGIFVLSNQVLPIMHTQPLMGTVKQGRAVQIAVWRAAPAHYRTGTEHLRCQPPEPAHLSFPTLPWGIYIQIGIRKRGAYESCSVLSEQHAITDVTKTRASALFEGANLFRFFKYGFVLQGWNFSFLGRKALGSLEDGLVGQVLATQAWRPKFRFPHLCKSWGQQYITGTPGLGVSREYWPVSPG